MSMSEATKEAVYLRRFLSEFGFESYSRIKLNCDNQGAVKLVENPVFHDRTKPIDIRHQFVREVLMDEEIKLNYIPTDEIVADVFTKGLPGPKHKE